MSEEVFEIQISPETRATFAAISLMSNLEAVTEQYEVLAAGEATAEDLRDLLRNLETAAAMTKALLGES